MGAQWPIRPELILVAVARSDKEYFYSPLDGMQSTAGLTPVLGSLVPFIHLGGERHCEHKVSCSKYNAMSLTRT